MNRLQLPPLPRSKMYEGEVMTREWQEFFRVLFFRVGNDATIEDLLRYLLSGAMEPSRGDPSGLLEELRRAQDPSPPTARQEHDFGQHTPSVAGPVVESDFGQHDPSRIVMPADPDFGQHLAPALFNYYLPTIVWDDMRIVPGSFDRPGVSDPTIVAVGDTYLYQFADGNIASFTIQLPHGYWEGSDIYVHIHWTPGSRGVAENGNLVGWKVDYAWADINAAFGAMATADLSDACNGVNYEHNMTPEVVISGTGKGLSSMLVCNVKRTDTGADDTWVGTISGQRPLLLEIDFHFPINTVGSRLIGHK